VYLQTGVRPEDRLVHSTCEPALSCVMRFPLSGPSALVYSVLRIQFRLDRRLGIAADSSALYNPHSREPYDVLSPLRPSPGSRSRVSHLLYQVLKGGQLSGRFHPSPVLQQMMRLYKHATRNLQISIQDSPRITSAAALSAVHVRTGKLAFYADW
jgi:hypothetical protein